MKNAIIYTAVFTCLFTCCRQSSAQRNFSPEAYTQFLEEHKNYSAGELLNDHPAKTVNYSSRQYPADLSDIPWYDTLNDRFRFTIDENRLLRQNFFMVSERMQSFDWASAFISLYSSDLPLFISSDFVLSTLHNSYDAILQTIEWQFLEPNLLELLHAMYGYFPQLVEKYAEDTRFTFVLNDVDLYISIALSLAEGDKYLPQYDTPGKYNDVMAAVEAEEMTDMKLFTADRDRKIDFSQFTPRGHYNKDIYTQGGVRTLEKYFRAMMWLGRIDFLLTAPPENPWEKGWSDEELLRMQHGALLLNEALHTCGKIENMEKHEEIISFLVGPDDNMTPVELKGLSDQLLNDPQDLFEQETFKIFMETLNASDNYGQKIMSNFFLVDPHTSDPGKLPVSFKLLGQKFLLDSYVFSNLVYDRIVYEEKKIWRPLPDPLDAIAALGNEDALALLKNEMDTYKYAGNMSGLKYLIDAYDADFWEQSLYNTWLDAIRSLNPLPSADGLPYFMKTTAWHHEKLNTQLTSWAQLRHDNILYGKQSYTGGTGCSYPFSYVEPYPDLYEKLKSFAQKASGFFGDVFTREQVESKQIIVDHYNRYAEIMEMFASIAAKEVEHTKLTDNEITFLKTMINQYMVSGPSITGWYNDLFFNPEMAQQVDFTVADVHTQPTDEFGNEVGNVLHVGNGLINQGVFIANNPCNPGQLMVFMGPVSSFHYKITANFERLTDQDWKEYFWAGPVSIPDRPDWVAPYLVDHMGVSYQEGRALKGTIFTGTGISQDPIVQTVDYLILFPNPVKDEAHVRFLLNRESELTMEIFDLSGRPLFAERKRNLVPAEHDIAIPVREWAQGIYLLRMKLGNELIVKELVIQ